MEKTKKAGHESASNSSRHPSHSSKFSRRAGSSAIAAVVEEVHKDPELRPDISQAVVAAAAALGGKQVQKINNRSCVEVSM